MAAQIGSQSIGSQSIGMAVPTLGERPEWLERSLASILAQQIDIHVEIGVVSPPSPTVAAICRANQVRHIEFEPRGLSEAINHAQARLSAHPWFAWLGDDDLLAPEALSLAADGLRAHPEAVACYGDVRFINADGSTRFVMRPGRWSVAYMRFGRNYVPQPGSLFRASAWSSVGGLREEWRNSMDQDLFLRLQRVGPIAYVHGEVAAFRVHGGSISTTKGSADDESHRVRASNLSGVSSMVYTLSRPLFRVTDRVTGAVLQRLPCREPAELAGRPYTA